MTLWRSLALTLVLAILAAGVGVWGATRYVLGPPRPPAALHEVLHRRLDLTADQQERIDGLERDHAARRRALEAEMRAATLELAAAYQEAHAYTPAVQGAIDRIHRAMGALQTETIVHVIAMRSVLRPRQAKMFDDTVVKSLTAQGS